METVAFCEIEEYPRKVLAKHWPDVPIYDDVRTLTGDRLRQDGITVDVICGGYPCQPFSLAGDRGGESDDRHLWPEVARLLQELEPDWAVFENVYGHISMGLDDVLSDLERLGYSSETFVIPACALDAKHRRDRVWIVAYPKHVGRNELPPKACQSERQEFISNGAEGRIMAYTDSERPQGCGAEWAFSRGEGAIRYGGQSGSDRDWETPVALTDRL